MDIKELNYYYNKFKFGEDNYHNLMKKKVREILLVSTFYDAFIFEQDGRLSEQIFGEYRQLNLSTAPRITSVPTGKQALEQLKTKRFDLVITMMRIGELSPFKFSREVKQAYSDIPVILLLNVQSDISIVKKHTDDMQYIDNVFIWNGDTKLFLAMVKSVEDKWNVDFDTKNGFVRVVLLVEDSILYYSMFLPLLYSVIVNQTQRLIQEEVNDINKRLRMRARPKVILVHNYEEAKEILDKYKDYLITVISDVRYPHFGKTTADAGINLIKKVQEEKIDLPIILQSSEPENEKKAKELGVSFLNKQSKTLLNDLRSVVIKKLGFGDFIFRNSNGIQIDSASTMDEFVKKLENVSEESIAYHSENNSFSSWLIAHGEIEVAKNIKPIKIQDFNNTKEIRQYLISLFKNIRKQRTRGKIINFSSANLNEEDQIIRLSEGSMGGKGRGMAFLNALLVTMEYEKKFPGINITLPTTAIIGTSEFDQFIENNNIGTWITEKEDNEIKHIFANGLLTNELKQKLEIYIDSISKPIAVRSSGLLEDSQSQPFAGIYTTYMLPNNEKDKRDRLNKLQQAIKLVFASVYLKNARNYIESINYKIEEEKMAVIIQEIAGSKFEDYFYPHISGVGQSYNFYPTSYLQNKDGIVSLALGLGKSVVEGERNFKFCPRYPKMEIITSSELLKESQKEFYALKINHNNINLLEGETITMDKLSINIAEKHGSLNNIASVWDYQNNRMTYNLFKKGPRVISFANILKYNHFPLAQITDEILEIGQKAMGVPVEIEFAVNLKKDESKGIQPTFYVLQIRPLTINIEEVHIEENEINKDNLFLCTERGMGNGVISNIYDIIYINPKKFDNTKTKEMRYEIAELNEKMKNQNRKYILIGPGRWGSRDRFLGIPVKWAEINQAKIIVEAGLENYVIDASQGTHFFHNLVAMDVGYFTVNHGSEEDWIDWEWLSEQEKVTTTEHFIHVRIDHPLRVKMDGKKGLSVIYK